MEVKIRLKAVIYVRVSSKEQEREGFSIPAQLSLLSEYALKEKLNVVKIFQEAETAKKSGRKGFENMLNFIMSNPDVKVILVEKTDRLYRNFKDYVKLDFEELGLEIHNVKENQILSKRSDSNQKFMHGIKVLMAKSYIDNLSEEVKKGHAEKLKLGIWPGKAPIGYSNKLDDHTIIKNEKIAPFISKAFELALTGNHSLRSLKRELYNFGVRGARSGNELSKSQMAKILSNPFYYGEILRSGVRYKGTHSPIISKTLFDQVQFVMGFVKKPSFSKHDFVFRGPLTCGHCGSQITAELKKKKSGKNYTYYHCTNGKSICSNVTYIREEVIEQQYIEAFKKITLSEDIIEFTRTALLSSHHDEKVFRESQIENLLTRYKKLGNLIDKAYEDKLESRIEPDYWESKTVLWKGEQEEISGQIEALRRSNTLFMLEGVKLLEIANSAARLFPMMTMEEKREVLSLVLSNPVIENGTIRYDYKKPFDMFVNVNDLKKWRERGDSNPRPSA
jgi:site-specific DNA recombinase